MVKLIFVRGASAVGKTTITKRLLKVLKTKHNLDCAYICEDDFRKQMQFKYKSTDLIVHQKSVLLIESLILYLLELDTYDLIFIEGLFRYNEILQNYFDFASEHNFDSVLFQFELDFEEMKRRNFSRTDKLTNDIPDMDSQLKNFKKLKDDLDSFIPEDAIIIDTNRPRDDIVDEVLSKLL